MQNREYVYDAYLTEYGMLKKITSRQKHTHDMATQNQSIISQTIKNLSHYETTILTLSVNQKEPKHISYGYEIFQTTKVRQETSSKKLKYDSRHIQQSSNKNNQPQTTKSNILGKPMFKS